MNAQEVVTKAQGHMIVMGKKSSEGVTSMSRKDDGWAVSIEAVERKGIPDTMDILGLYEVVMNSEGDLLSVERKRLRKRGDTAES